ncbi:unnamed protein product [Rhizopus stolonifer]
MDVFNKRGKKIDVDEIEEILAQIMVDEFEVILEDDSPYHVAKHLYSVYTQCIQGNFTEVERLREKFKTQDQFAASSCTKQESEDDISEDDMDDENDNEDQDMEESAPEEPTVDADGWETVRRK